MLQPPRPLVELLRRWSFPATLRWLAFALCCLLLGPAQANSPNKLSELPSEPLGHWLQILVEEGDPLSLDEARRAVELGKFKAATQHVPKFGIGADRSGCICKSKTTGAWPLTAACNWKFPGWIESTFISSTGMS